jgi:hypothetical protein|tara:strand:- start:4795 stop:5178 length:384 start_codon:yes stop_codon:yes gene_type:complete
VKLSEYLKAINHSKETLLDTDDEFVEKKYMPFIINRCLSYFPDTIFYVNEMNACPSVDKKMHFDYLLNIIRKRKRYSKWLKTEESQRVNVIKEYYGYSDRKAREVVNIFTDSDIEEMAKYLYTGGKK